MTHPPRLTLTATRPAVSPAMQALAVLLFVIPLAGTAVHVAMHFLATGDFLAEYYRSHWLLAVTALAGLNFLAAFLHGRKTRMRLDTASRVLALVWLTSVVILMSDVIRANPADAP